MLHLKQISLATIEEQQATIYPFNVPSIRSLAGNTLTLESPVTFLIGENGSGKSTFLEALACNAGSITVGSTSTERDQTLDTVRLLARNLRLSWKKRTRRGFFMRSEDFFGFVKQSGGLREELEADLEEIDQEFEQHSAHARNLARGAVLSQLAGMRQHYGENLDAASHGESYFTLFKARFVPDGLYLLDEPEAPLSPMRQIGFMSLLKTMVEEHRAQFIIATHSPILMAFPGAVIYSFDEGRVRPISYQETEHVTVTRAFLNNPERFLKHL